MLTTTFLPILTVDLIGSILMIVFSFLCLRLVFRIRRQDKNNIIWTYLLAICIGLTCFAVSRSAGHILKNILLLTGYKTFWIDIRPFSGAINTFMFIVVGAITLFFERVWKVYQLILKDRQALKSAHEELLFLNQNLERLVQERTTALSLSEHKYRQIFEVSKDMILVTKHDGSIVNLNPAGYALLEINDTSNNMENRHIQDFLMDRQDWNSIISAIEGEGSISSVELSLKSVNDSEIQTLFSGSVAKGSVKEEDTIHFLVKDIGQRKMMEEHMAQADKLASIGELSSGIAHEINNPLGVILGYTQLLLRNEDSQASRRSDLKTIEKHVKNCRTIVEDLLSFARTSETRMETVDIHRIIDDVLTFIHHHANLDQIRIEKRYDPSGKLILIDEKKIEQVLINLIMNAIHAIGKKGMIRLSTAWNREPGRLLIKVNDDGCGIEKSDISKIFDPFFTTKSTGKGTGLGLSVSYGIIKNHGGDIFVESSRGQGTTFTVALPVTPNRPGESK
jgi:PAS domain S-box-containing protein